MSIAVKVPTILRTYTGGVADVTVEGGAPHQPRRRRLPTTRGKTSPSGGNSLAALAPGTSACHKAA